MSARHLFPMLSCEDLERSLALYRDLLGGHEAYRFPESGDPVFVTLRFGDAELGLGQMSGESLHGRAQRPATGHRIELCVYVEDVDSAVERLRGAGVPVVTEPSDRSWGERVAYIEDPDGNLVMLAK